MSPYWISEEDVLPDEVLRRKSGRPHVAVLLSLNFPDMDAESFELHTRFTRNTLAMITEVGASFSLVDSTAGGAVSPVLQGDALLILGGGDIVAACYGGPADIPHSYGQDLAADEVSLALIRATAAADAPILGICRGSQLINVAFGGTVIPDITDFTLHHGAPGSPLFVDEPVEVDSTTRLASLVGPGPLVVRSGHHQAVDRVGEGLRIAARAMDGITEAVEHESKWIVGVQFHPEDDRGAFADGQVLKQLVTGLIEAT